MAKKSTTKTKTFNPNHVSLDQTIMMFETMMDNMANRMEFEQFNGVMLSGPPGTGKTQRIGLFAKMLGMPLITLEAPHLIEEHIINIPFIISNGGKESEYSVQLAESNLYSIITEMKVLSDEELLTSIYSAETKEVAQIFEQFGGNKTTIPAEFKVLREHFSSILFFDEFFRQTSVRIRNMLRGILNNKIGTHELPSNTYVVYATNLHDDGIDEISINTQFEHIELQSPKKDEWFSWFVSKYQNSKIVKLSDVVVYQFYTDLVDGDINFNDDALALRTSPRRWEQLILYVNSSLPVANEQEAKNLMSNVKVNFKHYLKGKHSNLSKKVLHTVAGLIKETSGIEVSDQFVNAPHEWRETLKHQIQVRQKLGSKLRSYVPVISGQPGIAKTHQARSLAKELDLRFIDVDVSTLNADDAVGLPLARMDGKNIKTVFSQPSLYQYIMGRMEAEDLVYFETLKKEFPEDFEAKIEEYKARTSKYLIFFDELNRNTVKVFNAIRRIVLEKNFGLADDNKTLLCFPETAIMLAAINPNDVGAQELTSHMQDVLDIIDAKPDWQETVDFMATQKLAGVDESTHSISLEIVKKFAHKFQTRDTNIPLAERAFNLDISRNIWMSPREYDMFYKSLVRNVNRFITVFNRRDVANLSTEEMREAETDVRQRVYNTIERNLSFVLAKHGIQTEEVFEEINRWVMKSDDIEFGEALFYSKAFDTNNFKLVSVLADYLDNTATTPAYSNCVFISYLSNTNLSTFREDLTDVIIDRFNSEAKALEYIIEDTIPLVTLDGKNVIVSETEKVSKLEAFMRSIVYTLQLNCFSNDKIEAVYFGIFLGLKQFRTFQQENIHPEILSQIGEKTIQISTNFDIKSIAASQLPVA
jgi:DNA polymerase III delta prime subunit